MENARPEQIIRFYLADEERCASAIACQCIAPRASGSSLNLHWGRHNWDDTYHHGETLLTDPKTGAEVLHYVRNFPLLCAPRDYVFSRRSFVKGDSYITVSKSCTLQACSRIPPLFVPLPQPGTEGMAIILSSGQAAGPIGRHKAGRCVREFMVVPGSEREGRPLLGNSCSPVSL